MRVSRSHSADKEAAVFAIKQKLSNRAEELFRQQQREIYLHTDQLIAKLMFWQWLATIIMALVISPHTWVGQTSAIHIHVWVSVFVGGAISLFPIWMTRAWPAAAITRHVFAVAQMLMSALLISVTGGRIETHFHVFGSLVILSFYRDWRVLIPATIVVGLDHFLRGIYWPYSVYGVLSATPWRSIEHAAWVGFEDIFLVISCFRSIDEMRSIANRTAALEASEESFRRIFDEAPIGVALVDPNYRFVKVNTAMCDMVGYSRRELTQLRSLDITLPEDVDATRQNAQELANGGSGCSFEKRYIRKDKEIIWVQCSVHPIEFGEDQTRYYLGMIKDITQRKRAEEEIRELNQVLEQRVEERTSELLASEKRYRMLFDQNPEPMWVFDLETLRFLEVNQAAVEHYGYSREEFLTMTLKDIRPPEDVPALIDDVIRLQSGAPNQRIWKHRKKDGSLIDAAVTASDFAWNDRRSRLVLAIDISERKRAEDALREAEQKYRDIFENAIEGIFQTTPDGKWISANPALARMYGYATPQEFIASAADIAKLYVVPERRDELRQLLETRNFVEGFEFECYRKDGTKMWLSESARAVRDADGGILYYEGAVQDVTEHKKAEQALQEAERKYREIFENSIEGIFQTTPDGHYISVNPALARIYGYDSPEELTASVTDIGHSIYVDPERRDEFKRLIETHGFVELFEYEVYRKDGRRIWLCENARAVRDANGTVAYYEGSVEEITERKLVDEVKRASKAKSEFLSRMSHELRTPLNAILGFGQLLERQKPTELQRKRIGYILRAGRHLLDLINEVLDISRIEAGRIQMSLEPVCVSDALEESLDLMRPLATERTIKLSASVDIDADVHVLADRQRFKQVLLNLLNNAVKYTPFCGAVTVSYSVDVNDKVRVLISDTGPGIPAQKLARLFVPFERLGAEQSTVEGTGLGLALSQRLIQAMGGSIGVDSAVGKGSTFWIELPRTKSPLKRLPVYEKNTAVPLSNFAPASRRILYIEDNLSNLALIEQVLAERPGTALLTTMQGKVGLDLARQHSPDLILLDLHLPDLPGWEVLSELKNDATTSHIPVVVISADATKRQINRLMAAGAAHYLTKPLDITQFFGVLDETTAAPSTNEHLAEVESLK
jgi:PAS domain S-box-containing protein